MWGPVLDESAVQTFSLMKLSKRLPQVMRISSASDEHTRVIQDLLKDLSYVRKEVSREYQIFQDPDTSTSNSHIFLQQQQQRLMLLFLKDISMGLCHHILANKIQREEIFSKGCHTSTVSRQLNAISLPWHILGWIFLLALNFGMLFYVYLFAMNQSHSRQSAWLKSFLMWLGFDFLIASTSMVFVTHLLIPLYVLADITKLKEKVLTDLTSFRNQWMRSQSSKTKRKIQKSSNTFLSSSSPQQFNSAKYLYVSWRIASLLHNLQFKRTSLPCHPSSNPEDDLTWTRSGTIMLILQYHTIWPKKSYGLRGVEIQDEYQENVLINGLTQILLYFITSFFNSHTSGLILQDIVIQMISITGFGFVIILLIRLWHFSSILCISILIIFFLFIVILLKYLQSSPSSLVNSTSNVNQTIHPINDDTCVKENQEGENEKQEEEEEMEMLEEGVENEKDDAHDCDDDSISVRRNNILSSSSSDLNQSSSASSSSSFSYFSHSHDYDNSGDVESDSSSQSDIESAIVIRKIDQTKNIRKSDDIENVCEA